MEPCSAQTHLIPILVVGEFSDAAMRSLEQIGFAVHIASTAIEMLAALTSGLRPRLVLLDMRIPEQMDRAVLAALKTKEFGDLPVVVLSTFDAFREDPQAKVFVLPSLDRWAIHRIARSVVSPAVERPDAPSTMGPQAALHPGGVALRDAPREGRKQPRPRPGSTRIMVVEDDADHRATLIHVLEDAGYAVSAAAHGREALHSLSAQPLPALVLLDLMMPQLDGWGFIAEVARNPSLSKIPIVVLSAGSNALFDAAPQAAGYLRKPLDHGKLLHVIQRCLQEPQTPQRASDPHLLS